MSICSLRFNPKIVCLVMEYCGGGDLLSALTRRKAFTEAEAAFYICGIVLALSHLHSRDSKPKNVVMDL
uniref:AlNc14C176G8138 protein n=1 Tax=Albugo laibachii Nc14 TaxID=890382 RepID=F0WNY3_9STRA|nr:AlNc14C176G8138 [Albugo laibachii Nc14]|eukprot:CCA23026.1 AlNc14C176G8138 [Albugo laibachii Nc14]